MSQTPFEKSVVNAITAMLKKSRAIVINNHGSGMTRSGIPDLTGVLPGGQAFAIEVKRPGRNKVTRLQERNVRLWGERGARAGFASSVREAELICFGPLGSR